MKFIATKYITVQLLSDEIGIEAASEKKALAKAKSAKYKYREPFTGHEITVRPAKPTKE